MTKISATRGSITFIVILTVSFFALLAGLQVLLILNVSRQSVAWDSYRQGAVEGVQFERVVEEVVQNQKGIHWKVSGTLPSVDSDVASTLARLSVGSGATYQVTSVPALPTQVTYPSLTNPVTALTDVASAEVAAMSPDLKLMAGARAAVSDELVFGFRSTRSVLDISRSYDYQVRSRVLGVPLSRFSICAYEYPSELGSTLAVAAPGAPLPANPLGLVPGRDAAFRSSLQASASSLPYAYRRRATLAAAYQYLFSQQYFNRLSLYAGITHFYAIDAAPAATAQLEGMLRIPSGASLDVGVAGRGRFGVSDDERSTIIVYTNTAGQELELSDSVGNSSAAPLFLLVCGPQNRASGRLTLRVGTIARPIVIVGSNVSVEGASGVSVNGAVLLDPDSALPDGTGPISMRHLSYKAGSASVAASGVVVSGQMPAAAEQIIPRVLYVLSTTQRL